MGKAVAMLLDPETLKAVIPGCRSVEKISDTHFRADVTLGIGPVTGRYRANVKLSDLDPPRAVTLGGAAEGALGFGSGEGRITLEPDGDGRVVTVQLAAGQYSVEWFNIASRDVAAADPVTVGTDGRVELAPPWPTDPAVVYLVLGRTDDPHAGRAPGEVAG